MWLRVYLSLLLLVLAPQASAQVVNGNFESGFSGWSSSAINGGTAGVVTEGTSFSSGTTTNGIIFPDGTRAMNVRSSGPAPTNSVGIATSTTWTVTHQTLRWRQRSETSRVNINMSVRSPSGTVYDSWTEGPSVGSFATRTRSVAARCGQQVQLRIAQNTTQAGSGWYSLFDIIEFTGTPCAGYGDGDGDGYCVNGRDLNRDGDCTDAGEPGTASDCNDANAAIHPGATDIPGNNVDENCDGSWTCYRDTDGDDYGSSSTISSANSSCVDTGEATNASDCDDSRGAVHPGATEVTGNNLDEDCNGQWACFVDSDGDDFGTSAIIQSSNASCTDSGEAVNDDDCNDTATSINPNATDAPGNDLDEDCSGDWDCYVDGDGDDFGISSIVTSPNSSCTNGGEATNDDDCDDTRAAVNPDAAEIGGNAVDEDCSGDWDCFVDSDGDGFGSSATLTSADADCSAAGESAVSTDCDDTRASVNPNGTDQVGNTLDEDCSGTWDCYIDSDGDDFGTSGIVTSPDASCAEAGEAAVDGDCDDTRATTNPDADEIPGDTFDDDCSGDWLCFVDSDADGFGSADTVVSTDSSCDDDGEADDDDDCDDTRSDVSPLGSELPGNATDEDCTDTWACYVDNDGDDFGVPDLIQSSNASCADAGEADNALDCDDDRAATNPDADEVPGNAFDDDCSGDWTCFVDGDGDTFGTSDTLLSGDASCSDSGEATVDGDCDDDAAGINPGADEIAGNDVDEDCSGDFTCFVDNDADTFGTAATVASDDADCTGAGESSNADDCDDTRPAVNPNGTDQPGNALDEDCSGDWLCWADDDGDTYGAMLAITSVDEICTDAGESPNADDCDDTNAAINRDGLEVAGNNVDEDCDNIWLCYVDGDADSFGSTATVDSDDASCTDPGEAVNDTDCNDASSGTFPGADEVPGNRVDEDCDDSWSCWADLDGDTFGGTSTVESGDDLCTDPGESVSATDCNDTNPSIFPGATEIPGNGIDEDCSGSFVCFVDNDVDGFGDIAGIEIASDDPTCAEDGLSATADDCDDSVPTTYPGAPDLPGDRVDDDCDGLWTCWVDLDGDGAAAPGATTVPSTSPDCEGANQASTDDDCDDNDPTSFPGAVDTPADGIDQDCNGLYTCWADADADRFGDPMVTATSDDPGCDTPGATADDTDCNDSDGSVYPGAPELAASGVDANCDDAWTCWADSDGDDFGDAVTVSSVDTACDGPGEATNDGDCDDDDDDIYPGAEELPATGVDSDCDELFTCYLDNDLDGAGTPALATSTEETCTEPGTSPTDDDCDDDDDTVAPDGTELPADGVDSDCDGEELCYVDADEDTFGGVAANTLPSLDLTCVTLGLSDVATDCDDLDPLINPDATELEGNDIDEDCSGDWLCWTDADGDGFGGEVSVVSVDPICDADGEADASDDCDDTDDTIFPGAAEVVGNAIDEDCDGAWDCFEDADGDGFGGTPVVASEDEICDDIGESETNDDCDDTRSDVFPGAPEIAGNDTDEDCDGEDTPAEPEPAKDLSIIGGCACDGGASPSMLWLLLALVGLRRRRH